MTQQPVTVVTPAVPTRLQPNEDGEVMFTTAMRSVAAQTVKPTAHLVKVDYAGVGLVKIRNSLVGQVETEWFVPLDDDDILQKPFLERHLAQSKGADIVYSRVYIHGSDWAPYRHTFDAKDLRKENYIPVTALIRTELWAALGGYREREECGKTEDWDFWLRALDAGARFRHIPELLWIYRFHTGNLLNPEVVPLAEEEPAQETFFKPGLALNPNTTTINPLITS